MLNILFILLLFLLPWRASLLDPAVGSSHSIIVSTSLGKVRGRIIPVSKTGRNVGAFLGLPYAQPPIDDQRFRPPVPLNAFPTDEVDATQFTPICYQPGEQKIWDVVYSKGGRGVVKKRRLEQYNMSEDCLTLQIYVPLQENDSIPTAPRKLAVLFFIHGGSYYMNAGRLYPGQVLASSQNIIVITFNYRLGPLGFFSTGDGTAPGNYGLLDQALALDWVHQHIPSFGGDQGRITLVGNSAGGASVMFHIFSDISRGKFVGAIIQSGCSGAPWAIQHNPGKHAQALASKLGCPTVPSHDLVNCVRNFSPQLIMKHAKLEDGLSLAFAAVIDGWYGGREVPFLRDLPSSLIKSKSFHGVPLLTGFTRDEVTIWFTKYGPTMKIGDLRSFVHVDVISLLQNEKGVTQANMAAMIHSVTVQYLYRSGIGENDTVGKTSAVSDFISDVGLKAPCIKELNLLSHHTHHPIHLYEFQYSSVDDYKMGRQEWIGAYHESELQYVLGEPYLNYSNHLRSYDDKKMSDIMMSVWANFVKFGQVQEYNEITFPDPGVSSLQLHRTPTPTSSQPQETPPPPPNSNPFKFDWANYTEHSQDYAVLSLKSHAAKFFLTDRMLFWNFFFPIFRDYPFRFEGTGPPSSCSSLWGEGAWGFWLLLALTITLTISTLLLSLCELRRKLESKTHHRPPINTNNLPLMPR